MVTDRPIIVILGQTASGKSALGIELAQKYQGEIICADSRTIYKSMDIGTAKPSAADQAAVKHWGIDLIEPNESFSAAAFKRYAEEKVSEISARGKLPIVVGGTGLYIDGLIYDFDFRPPNPEVRAELDCMSLDELQQRAENMGIAEDAVNFGNKRHLSRAIERSGQVGSKKQVPPNILLVGLHISQDKLAERIQKRVTAMVANGFVDEVQELVEKYGAEAPGLLAPGYKAFAEYLEGNVLLDEAEEIFARNDKRLAKRQLTWFKRNQDIVWIDSPKRAEQIITPFLSKFDTIDL